MQTEKNTLTILPEYETETDALFNWKVQQALYHLKDSRQSRNPYNEPGKLNELLKCEIQCREMFDEPSNGYQYIKGLAPGRAKVDLNESIVISLSLTMPITGYYQLKPIIFDKDWRVLDGLNRLHVCKKFNIPYSWIKIDY